MEQCTSCPRQMLIFSWNSRTSGALPHLSKSAYKAKQCKFCYLSQGSEDQASPNQTNTQGRREGVNSLQSNRGKHLHWQHLTSHWVNRRTRKRSWSIFKQDLIITMNTQCFPGSSRYANMRWIISPSQSLGSRNASLHGHTQWTRTTRCPDTSESVWKSILLGGRLHNGEQKTC